MSEKINYEESMPFGFFLDKSSLTKETDQPCRANEPFYNSQSKKKKEDKNHYDALIKAKDADLDRLFVLAEDFFKSEERSEKNDLDRENDFNSDIKQLLFEQKLKEETLKKMFSTLRYIFDKLKEREAALNENEKKLSEKYALIKRFESTLTKKAENQRKRMKNIF